MYQVKICNMDTHKVGSLRTVVDKVGIQGPVVQSRISTNKS